MTVRVFGWLTIAVFLIVFWLLVANAARVLA